LLNLLVSFEFDEDRLEFADPVNKIYGQAFYRIIPKLIDLIVEESLCVNENPMKKTQKEHSSVMLSIIRYVLKTISIKSLIKAGIKEIHLEFIIKNFCHSKFAPKVSF
jgi:hypothetical protein